MQQTKQNRFPFVAVPTAWLQRLTPQEGWVAIAIASHADKHGAAWPSVNALAAETGLCRRTIQRALRRLVDKGVITVAFRQRENGSNTSNQYTIDLTGGSMTAEEGGRLKDAGGASQRREGGVLKTPLELDPDQLDPVELDPPTPPNPLKGEGACVDGSPSAQSEPSEPLTHFDTTELQYRRLPWEVQIRQADPAFLLWVEKVLPPKEDTATARRTARAYVQKARTNPERFDAVLGDWQQYQQQLQEQAQAAELEAQMREADRWRRQGY
jgi:hypothetical protein